MNSLYSLKATISAHKELMPGVHLIEMEQPLSGEPGQFYMVRCDDSGQRLLRRPLALHCQQPRPAFLFKVTGEGTAWLAQKRPGEVLDILGPLGRGFSLSPASHRVLLLAGGLVIAP
ncbi:MAG: dihydroorotate dehydrogenase electron transfer subunit, partial [Chloroflexota bacterium]